MHDKRPIIIVDGMNIFVRNFLVNETINAASEPVGGVVGFIRFVDSLVYRFSPAKIIVVWENGGPSPKRKRIYPGYKNGRSKLKAFKRDKKDIKSLLRNDSENKINQLSMLYQLLKKTPICQIFIKETEADDIIGYLTKYVFKQDNRLKLITSSDKDFYQLLEDDNVKIFDPARKITLDADYVKGKFNISPRNFCLARALIGDPSDNLDGISGIGFKTVSKRFEKFQDDSADVTIDGVIRESKELLATKAGSKLKAIKGIVDNEDIIRRNWKLMYLSSNNLSPSQIEKVLGTLEQHEPHMDKLGLIKEITKAGLNISFDFDKFSMSMKQSLLFD